MFSGIPLPKVVADVGPGGPLVTAMQGINALQRSNIQNQYLPLTSQAEAASKLAYANLMGPQFLAKLMGHPDIVANSQQLQDPATIQRLYQAGMGQGTGNALISMLGNGYQPSGLENVVNAVKNAFGLGETSKNQSASNNALLQNLISSSNQSNSNGSDSNGYAYDKNGNNIKATPQEIDSLLNKVPIPVPDNGTYNPSTVSAPNPDKYAENAARYKSIIKAGEELGTKRGEAISDIGKQQMDLSNSGVVLDHITGIVQNPQFQQMRSQIPYFQDKQLWFLSKQGTKEQQKMIGDFISSLQAFKSSTVNSFKGKALEKEFDLADKIKIDEKDTMGVAEGKLKSLTTLKDIAQAKNDMIIDLMQNQNMNEGDAVSRANKLINTKNIENQVDNLLNPPVTVMYKNNQKYHIPNDKVEAAKKAGYSNGR